MATVIVSVKLMPTSAETDLDKLKEEGTKVITNFGGTVGKTELEPVAFGLKALTFMFAMDEDKGSTEELEKNLAAIENVNSVQVTDVRRAIG
jgi:elongation factor 1-beta